MRLIGRITMWSPRGFGYVTVKNGTERAQYFLHISKIKNIDRHLYEPTIGCFAIFTPTDQFKRGPGDRPSAIDAEIIMTVPDPAALTAADVLSGKGGAE